MDNKLLLCNKLGFNRVVATNAKVVILQELQITLKCFLNSLFLWKFGLNVLAALLY